MHSSQPIGCHTPRPHRTSRPLLRHGTCGFSLVEVLVTLLLISLALLGASGLQTFALKLNQAGQFRTQAVLLASDLSERMEGNKFAAVAGAYVFTCTRPMPSASPGCGPDGMACSPSALAAEDLMQWRAAVVSALPQGSCSVVQSSVGNPSTYTILLTWVDRQTATRYSPSATTGPGTGEAMSYQASRTIFN